MMGNWENEYIKMNCVCTPVSTGQVNACMEEAQEMTYSLSVCIPKRCWIADAEYCDCPIETCTENIIPIVCKKMSRYNHSASVAERPMQFLESICSNLSTEQCDCRPLCKLRSGRPPIASKNCYPIPGTVTISYAHQRNPKNLDCSCRSIARSAGRYASDNCWNIRSQRDPCCGIPPTSYCCPPRPYHRPMRCQPTLPRCPSPCAPVPINCMLICSSSSPQPCTPSRPQNYCQPRCSAFESCYSQNHRNHCY